MVFLGRAVSAESEVFKQLYLCIPIEVRSEMLVFHSCLKWEEKPSVTCIDC